MIRVEGDDLIMTDAGFGLFCLLIFILLAVLIWQVVGLIRDWRAWRKERGGLNSSPPASDLK